jgi:hypothetical protein
MVAKYLQIAAAMMVILSGCAEGPTYQEAVATQSAIPAGRGRIAVFRDQQILGFGVKPAVLVDGLPTGICGVGSVFFVDVPPGQHIVSASTENTSVVRANVAAGQTTYVQCTINMGAVVGTVQLVPVSASSAMPKMNELVFTGQY